MTQSKHTPGPWYIQERIAQDNSNSLIFSDKDDVAIVGAASPDEQTANARLIAAAPELLEVAGRAVSEYITVVCNSQNLSLEEAYEDEAVKGWLAVIAKARGQ